MSLTLVARTLSNMNATFLNVSKLTSIAFNGLLFLFDISLSLCSNTTRTRSFIFF